MSEARQPAVDTRRRLLHATWQIVRDHGLRAATSRRITSEANANLGAITYHFGSKESLVTAALLERLDQWTAPLAAGLADDEAAGTDQRTNAAIASILSMLNSGPEDGRALLEVLVARDVDEQVSDALRSHLSGFQRLVADLITRRQQRQELPSDVNPAAMSGVLTAFAFGLFVQEAIGANPTSVSDHVTELLKLLQRAAPAPPPRESATRAGERGRRSRDQALRRRD